MADFLDLGTPIPHYANPMALLTLPTEHSSIYWTIAFIFSFYYGIQGFLIKRHEVQNENIRLRKCGLKEWQPWEQITIQCSEYPIFNFVCGLAGFVALYLECDFLWNSNLSNIDVGKAAVIIFLSLFSVLYTHLDRCSFALGCICVI